MLNVRPQSGYLHSNILGRFLSVGMKIYVSIKMMQNYQ